MAKKATIYLDDATYAKLQRLCEVFEETLGFDRNISKTLAWLINYYGPAFEDDLKAIKRAIEKYTAAGGTSAITDILAEEGAQ